MSSASKLFLPITYKKIAINQEKKKEWKQFQQEKFRRNYKSFVLKT